MDTQRDKGLRGSYTYGRNGFWTLWRDDIPYSFLPSLVEVYLKRERESEMLVLQFNNAIASPFVWEALFFYHGKWLYEEIG